MVNACACDTTGDQTQLFQAAVREGVHARYSALETLLKERDALPAHEVEFKVPARVIVVLH